MHPRQLGRLWENLVENVAVAVAVAVAGSGGGRLSAYEPILDARDVDRALAAGLGPPLFVQVAWVVPGADLAGLVLTKPATGRSRIEARIDRGDPRWNPYHTDPEELATRLLELAGRAAQGDGRHISFEARVDGPDPRWQEFRTEPGRLAAA